MIKNRLSLRFRLTIWVAVAIWISGFVVIIAFVGTSRARLQNSPQTIASQLEEGGPLGQQLPPQIAGVITERMSAQIQEIAGQQLREISRIAVGSLGLVLVGGALLSYGVAVRALRPLGQMTQTASRLSTERLGERMATDGPQDELHELAVAVNAMLDRLETSFAAQKSFSANASHELRTPLQIIRAEVDVSMADLEDPDLVESADAIRTALGRSEDVITSLLLLARAEQEPATGNVDLAVLVERSMANRERLLGDGAPDLDVVLEPALVRADPATTQLLVDNLVDNAIRHCAPGGRVWVRTDGGALAIANDGDHLDDDEVRRLTERFYRPDRSRSRATGGTGLGLSIVQAIVDANGADLRLTARPEGGLIVEVAFPIPAADVHAPGPTR